MANALSDYLESGLLNYLFRGYSFPKPENISVALTSGVPQDAHTGAGQLYTGVTNSLPELCSGIDYLGKPTLGAQSSGTGYSRVTLGAPSNERWSYVSDDWDAGSGVIRNSGQIIFNTALTDWGWVSGVALVDNSTIGTGNLLMWAELDNPRLIYTGDNVKFDVGTLEISFK